MENNRTLIARCMDAFNRHDVDAAAGLVTRYSIVADMLAIGNSMLPVPPPVSTRICA